MKPGRAWNTPPAIDALHAWHGKRFSYATYKTLALVITFWCYCMFHATRKPPSVVKRCARAWHCLQGTPADGWRPPPGWLRRSRPSGRECSCLSPGPSFQACGCSQQRTRLGRSDCNCRGVAAAAAAALHAAACSRATSSSCQQSARIR